ncbi:MAG: oxamate carbamoyltransferase subunit AllG family protein [Thiomonas delicata]|jgi:hypothetical protein
MSAAHSQSQRPGASGDALHDAAKAAIAAAEPAWLAVRTAHEALHLPDFTLLHAGPPIADPRRLAAPLRMSCVLACLHEGWAHDEAEAVRLLADGRITLQAAQDHGVVTPLAAVISLRSVLVEVVDLASDLSKPARAWSLLSSGAGPQLRFGVGDRAILARMAWRDGTLAETGLRRGDDRHARTTAAQLALHACLQARLDAGVWTGANAERRGMIEMLATSPLFFLTLWMAACHLLLVAAAGPNDLGSPLEVGMAGNGEQMGIRLAGRPGEWFVASAASPAGPRLDPAGSAEAAPFLGDSGVIDAMGFGGQALARAPELAAVVASNGLAPLVTVAMPDVAGGRGLLGRGLYIPLVELFVWAAAAVRADLGVVHPTASTSLPTRIQS